MEKTVNEMFSDFTELFSADGYQFIMMRNFLEALEKKENKNEKEEAMLYHFHTVAKLCRYFLNKNDTPSKKTQCDNSRIVTIDGKQCQLDDGM